MKITKEMKIEEVLDKYPEASEVFERFGFHCIGCAAASFESIEEGARAHGVTAEKLVEDLNKVIRKKYD